MTAWVIFREETVFGNPVEVPKHAEAISSALSLFGVVF